MILENAKLNEAYGLLARLLGNGHLPASDPEWLCGERVRAETDSSSGGCIGEAAPGRWPLRRCRLDRRPGRGYFLVVASARDGEDGRMT